VAPEAAAGLLSAAGAVQAAGVEAATRQRLGRLDRLDQPSLLRLPEGREGARAARASPRRGFSRAAVRAAGGWRGRRSSARPRPSPPITPRRDRAGAAEPA